MGNYLNPGNSGFEGIRNDVYVDKSGLISLVNQTINTPIYLDMTGIIGATDKADMCAFIKRNVTRELLDVYPQLRVEEAFFATLANAAAIAGCKFVMIIDEWDAPIRESADQPKVQREYLEFLRSLFKNSGATDKIFAAAY